MSKKSIMGLILFGSITMAGLFAGVNFMIGQGTKLGADQNQSNITEQELSEESANGQTTVGNSTGNDSSSENITTNVEKAVTQISSDSSDTSGNTDNTDGTVDTTDSNDNKETADSRGSSSNSADVLGGTSSTSSKLQLIYDSTEVDYKAYIPEMNFDSQLKAALDISNPKIGLDATAAILFDANTKEVLFYKNAVTAVYPASTAKLLTSLVALDWCNEEEEVTIGDEVKMIPTDATKAFLHEGEVLTIRNLLEGMLVPSGNDAAYATAVYVGRKSLQNPAASNEQAVIEFTRLMNLKAKELSVKNSCFKTPDGYDAIGQYTTAYDMGLIGLAAVEKETITDISKKRSARNVFVSGEDITWNNTNALINRNNERYYSCAIGLKTGTSTMAGRCLIAAARKDEKEVVCVIMNSSSAGRWEDAISLLKYGLQ